MCANEIKKRGVCFENCFIEIFSNKKLFKFLQIVFRLMEIFFSSFTLLLNFISLENVENIFQNHYTSKQTEL